MESKDKRSPQTVPPTEIMPPPREPPPAVATAAVALGQAAAASPVPPAAAAVATAARDAVVDRSGQAISAFRESQAAMVRGWTAMAMEFTALSGSSLTAAANAAGATMVAKTPVEAFRIQSALARQGFDMLIGYAGKVSEIGAKMASDATRPILARLDVRATTRALGV